MASSETVLVTGATGFLASHCVLQALEKGYNVRATVRSLDSADKVRVMLHHGGLPAEKVATVQFFAADLTSDKGWNEACSGCDYVLHVASPFPPSQPKHEDDLIIPAREGTLRALRAAKAAGTVKRVVVTSSVAAVLGGHGPRPAESPFTEADWTILEKPKVPVDAYPKSKTIAERAAWDWIEKEGNGLELATVNPGGILGPMLSEHYAASIELVSRLLNGQMLMVPKLAFGLVDVRDVADLELRAMTHPNAAGQRFIAVADGKSPSMRDLALVLKERLTPQEARKVPTQEAPNFLVRLTALFDPAAALIVPSLGRTANMSNAKAKTELGWAPRSAQDAIIASAKSLLEFGLAKQS